MIQISLKADHERPAGETTFSLLFNFCDFLGGGEGPDLQPHIYIYKPKYIPTYIHACTYIHVYTYVNIHTHVHTYIHS